MNIEGAWNETHLKKKKIIIKMVTTKQH